MTFCSWDPLVKGKSGYDVAAREGFKGLRRPYAEHGHALLCSVQRDFGNLCPLIKPVYSTLDVGLQPDRSATLPNAPIERLAVLRLAGNMYSSTMDSLVCLYDKGSIDGYLIVDDFEAVAGCQRAILDFRASLRIEEPMQNIDGLGIFWQKKKQAEIPVVIKLPIRQLQLLFEDWSGRPDLNR